MKKDILLLLADSFEKVISTCVKYYSLDPCHYFSAPGLSWDAILKMTTVELERISDPDKYMLFDYLDLNNNMDMQWVNIYHMLILNGLKIDKIKQKLMNIKSNSSTGYILEVDLEYPQELHDIHNDYALAPEKLTYQKNGYLIIV